MSAPRVFVNQPCAPGADVELDRSDARHLALVLRMKNGESITVVSDGVAWQAQLATVTGDRAAATIVERSTQSSSELPLALTVLQAIPKGMKMDDVVEKVVELGATRIVPIRCERSYGGDSEHKVERWRRIARAAARQSRRLIVPTVEQPAAFVAVVQRFAKSAQVIVTHEGAPKGSLAAALRRDATQALAIAIGPEGSFTEEELKVARDAGAAVVSLGPTILRTETAAAATIAAVAALRGWW